jgi:hypothetical protein
MRDICTLLLVLLALPVHSAMYKWIDPQGVTHYSDVLPPSGARKIEEPRIAPNTIEVDRASFAVQDAAKRNPVTLWLHDCGELCARARDYLAKRGVPHPLRNAAREGEQDAWKKANGGVNNIPLLVIGNVRTLMGFNEDQWSAALDAAGYPQNAPPLPPLPIPPADPQAGLKPPQPPAPAWGAASAADNK